MCQDTYSVYKVRKLTKLSVVQIFRQNRSNILNHPFSRTHRGCSQTFVHTPELHSKSLSGDYCAIQGEYSNVQLLTFAHTAKVKIIRQCQEIIFISVSGTQTPCIKHEAVKNVSDFFDDNIDTCDILDSPEGILMATLEVDSSCVNTSKASEFWIIFNTCDLIRQKTVNSLEFVPVRLVFC